MGCGERLLRVCVTGNFSPENLQRTNCGCNNYWIHYNRPGPMRELCALHLVTKLMTSALVHFGQCIDVADAIVVVEIRISPGSYSSEHIYMVEY